MNPLNPLLSATLASLPLEARVLDCGGWFRPLSRATHVVDLMPYETRGCALRLTPQPGERFTKDTWHQADFLSPDFRLPFSDKYFALSSCTHTVEDLADPALLLRELERVSRAGVLVTPSRLNEQTAGTRDRMTNQQGHPHHFWICETEDGGAVFSHKGDSLGGAWWQTAVPLRLTEHLRTREPGTHEWALAWTTTLPHRFIRGAEARRRAVVFARSVGAQTAGLLFDSVIRMLRRIKYGRGPTDAWWPEMVRLSQPYSRLPLR